MKVFEDLITAIEEMINTTTSVMAPYPVDVVGRPAPFGKNKKSQKKSYGEKRAPHTEISEELEKQKKGSQKKAMLGYKYRKVWSAKNMDLQETITEIADICEAILEGTSKATLYKGHEEGPFKDMNKDIDTFFKKADEFIQKRKEQNKKKK